MFDVSWARHLVEISRLVETFFNESGRAAAFSADLINVEAIPCLIDQVASHFGRLDILINSAANFLQPKFGETTLELGINKDLGELFPA